jgi:hypothetical protein
MYGMWRSLVARLLGMQEDVGSNPAIPTHARCIGSLVHAILGMWRSLVARSLRMREDVGSNPAILI